MISSHKFLAISLLIFLVLGTLNAVYYYPRVWSDQILQNEISAFGSVREEVTDDDKTLWSTVTSNIERAWDSTILDPLRIGWVIVKTMWKNAHPSNFFSSNSYTSTLERQIASVFTYLLGVVSLIIILEVYIIIKNKKTS